MRADYYAGECENINIIREEQNRKEVREMVVNWLRTNPGYHKTSAIARSIKERTGKKIAPHAIGNVARANKVAIRSQYEHDGLYLSLNIKMDRQ